MQDTSLFGRNLHMRLFLLLSISLIHVCLGQPPITPAKLIPYKETNKGNLHLHAFFPANFSPSDKRAAIVFFFGGGWVGGTPKQFYGQAKALSEKGMVAFCAEYRTKKSHGTTPFECVKDAKSAIQWVRKNASNLGVDPDRIVSGGGSAGGHIAACTGVIEGYEEEGTGSRPNAMVLFNPVLDTTPKGYGAHRFTQEQKTSVSPCHHVKKGISPTIIFQGTADTTTPLENAERFTQLMKDVGNTCILKTYEGEKHGFFNGKHFRPSIKDDSTYRATLREMVLFLKQLEFIQ